MWKNWNPVTIPACTTVKAARLHEILASMGRVAVAFSGGTDSSLLLAEAASALGPDNVLALTALSELTPAREKTGSAGIAAALGIAHIRVDFSVLSEPRIASNPKDRCYHCKHAVFSRLAAEAGRRGFPVLVHGANTDDLGDYRPGQKAAEELGVRAPLLEAGLGKAEIRAMARARGLPNWDEPSMACLASRVPYDVALEAAALERIDKAEEFLRSRFALRQVRVRDHMPVARIEVEEGAMAVILEPGNRAEIERNLKDMGWKYVAVDLKGFRTGSMNETII
jgi:uncharacterized protein